jgi:two-component system CheB/CheR fusion protein
MLSEPLIVLDERLTVVSVNRAFRELFQVAAEECGGMRIYELGNGQWNIPQLRLLLEDVLPAGRLFANFEVEQDFPALGRRRMLLGARKIERGTGNDPLILLSIKDMTDGIEPHPHPAKPPS